MDTSKASSSSSSSSSNTFHHQGEHQTPETNMNSSYSALLTVVTELRTDLEKAINKIKSLDDSNQKLKNNYLVVKTELVETKRKFNETAENYSITVTEKIEFEKQHEIFLENVKIKLDEKQKEFELLRDSFQPQDIDFIRIKVQEELEIPHKQKIQEKQAEIDSLKDAYSVKCREVDLIQTRFDITSFEQQKGNISLKESYETLVHSLRNDITKLNECNYSPEKDEKIRKQNLQIHEITHELKLLTDQTKVISQERDDIIYSNEQNSSKSEIEINKLRSIVAVAESDCIGFEQRLNLVTQAEDRKETQIRNFKSTVEDLSTQLESSKNQIIDFEVRYTNQLDEHNRDMDEMRKRNELDIQEMQSHNDSLSTRLYEREELVRKIQRDVSESQLRSEAKEIEIRRTHQLQIQEMSKKLSNYEIELADEKCEHRKSILTKSYKDEHEKNEFESIKSEVLKLRKEKGELENNLNNSLRLSETKSKKIDIVKKDSNAQITGNFN
jgi:hypothetical protein